MVDYPLYLIITDTTVKKSQKRKKKIHDNTIQIYNLPLDYESKNNVKFQPAEMACYNNVHLKRDQTQIKFYFIKMLCKIVLQHNLVKLNCYYKG